MKDLRVTLIQADTVWENRDANLLKYDVFLKSIPSESTDLIVLPEMFNTGYTMSASTFAEKEDGKTIQWMQKNAQEKKCVITGSMIVSVNGNYFNRLIWMNPDGTFQSYDKKHLFSFAGEQNHYSAGTSKIIPELNGWKILPVICYDLRFPLWLRNTKQNPYDVLLVTANWPERRSHPWKILLQARAIENQAFVVGVNRVGKDGNGISHSGDSCVIDPKGEPVQLAEPGNEECVTVSLSRQEMDDWRKSFPALNDADSFVI